MIQTQKGKERKPTESEIDLELIKRLKEYKADLSIKILKGAPLTKEEYYDALKFDLLMASSDINEAKSDNEDSFTYMPTYETFALRFYEDNKIGGWIDVNRERFGIPVGKLNREYLKPMQIKYLLHKGFKDEEIGSQVTQ